MYLFISVRVLREAQPTSMCVCARKQKQKCQINEFVKLLISAEMNAKKMFIFNFANCVIILHTGFFFHNWKNTLSLCVTVCVCENVMCVCIIL